jgi:hypothetical protein
MARRLSKVERELQEYQLELGKVIHTWSQLEYEFASAFRALTGLRRPISENLFYSGRNFRTRADLVRAALKKPKCSRETAKLIRAALSVADKYSAFRNAVAHDQHPHYLGVGVYTHGGDDDFSAVREGRAYSIDDLTRAHTNIERLRLLIGGPDFGDPVEGWEERNHERILQLPKLAHRSEPSPIPEKRQQSRKPTPKARPLIG